MGADEFRRVRAIALALPGVNERLSHGEPCFFVQDRRPLCYYHDDHNGDGRVSLWCPVPPGMQEVMIGGEAHRFFRPQPSAGGVFAGWLGIYLDRSGPDGVDWDEVAEIIGDAYRHVAPKRLVAELDDA